MAIKLTIPTTKSFYYAFTDKGFVWPVMERIKTAEEDHQVTISFRQATALDIEQRTASMSRRMLRQDQDGMMVVNDTNFDYVSRVEVMLTLAYTDIEFDDGRKLSFNKNRISDKSAFNEWWDNMPGQWAIQIHNACMETNPEWGEVKS